MKNRRILTSVVPVAAALLALAAVPASAPAGSLLSGYGGPGQGNQVILGSTLLGPKGGGTGGGSGGGGGGSASVSASALALSAAPRSGGGGTGTGSHGQTAASRRAAGRHSHGTASQLSPAAVAAQAAQSGQARSASAGSRTLGLSGADLFYIVLVITLLVLAGLFTRALIRGQGAKDGAVAKGMGRTTRGFE